MPALPHKWVHAWEHWMWQHLPSRHLEVGPVLRVPGQELDASRLAGPASRPHLLGTRPGRRACHACVHEVWRLEHWTVLDRPPHDALPEAIALCCWKAGHQQGSIRLAY